MCSAIDNSGAGPSRQRTIRRYRPRIRVSLRGLLVLLTAFCTWAAVQGNWIRKRNEARKWIIAHEAAEWSSAVPADVQAQKVVNGQRVWVADTEQGMPWGLKVLGERSLNYIILNKSKLTRQDGARLDSLRRLFPEAHGIHISEPGWCTCWPPTDVNQFWDRRPPLKKGPIAPLTAPLIPVN
jgi:hypothetical protein